MPWFPVMGEVKAILSFELKSNDTTCKTTALLLEIVVVCPVVSQEQREGGQFKDGIKTGKESAGF